MNWFVVVVLVCGCGRIGFGASGDDAVDDGGTMDDPDNDGFVGTTDNCPTIANVDQDDEDADALGDACDPCPISPNNTDGDDDGVGGECDPKPTTDGDRIVFFAGFERMPADLVLAGDWNLGGGQLHAVGTLNSLAAATWVNAGPEPEVVSTHVTIDALFGNLIPRPIGVVHHFDQDTREGTLCVFGIDPFNNEIYALADNAADLALSSAPTAANVGDASSFVSGRGGTRYSCDAERLAAPLNNINTVPVTNRAGLFARSGSASFDYLMIVKSTPPGA